MTTRGLKPETLERSRYRFGGLPPYHPDDADEFPEVREISDWCKAEIARREGLRKAGLPDPDRERIIDEAKQRWPWAYGLTE